MEVLATELPEVLEIVPNVFGDGRGFFAETWNEQSFHLAGIEARFVQDNWSRSACGVLRGLHYQLVQPQGKLVRVIRGAVFDVAVDLRRSSPRFGRWTGRMLSDENKHALWIPPGFAHGFLALADGTDFAYKCTDFYAPAHERTIAWNDPAIGIDWPLAGIGGIARVLVSDKDRTRGASLAAAEVYR